MAETKFPEVDRNLLGTKDLVFLDIRGGSFLSPEDTRDGTRAQILREMGLQACADRVDPKQKGAEGKMPASMDMKRYFITANRGFAITLRFEFVDTGPGFYAGLRAPERAKLKDIERQVKMFLN